MDVIEWVNDVTGRPWRDRCAGPLAYDCWGLVVDSFARIDGAALPDLEQYSSGRAIEDGGAEAASALAWPTVDQPTHGAVFAIYTSAGAMVHVGRVLRVEGVGLMAVHAAGRNGRGQVVAERVSAVVLRYAGRVVFYMRPTDATN